MNERIFDSRLAERIAGDDTARRDRLKAVARMLVGVVRDGLVRDGSVRVHGFGTFQLRPTKPRRGINPQTGERILIPARHRVIFRPAKALRERVDPDPGHAVPLAEPRASREAMLAAIPTSAPAAGALPAAGIPTAHRPQERPQEYSRERPGQHAEEHPALAAAMPQAVVSSSNARTPASAPQQDPDVRPIADAGRETAGSGSAATAAAAANESMPGGRPEPPDERPRRRGALLALLLLAFVAVLAWLLWPVAREPAPPVAEEAAESVTVPEVSEPAGEPPTDPDAVAPDIASVPVEPAVPEPEVPPLPAETVSAAASVDSVPTETPTLELTGPLAESHPQVFAVEPALDLAVTVEAEPLDVTLAGLAPTPITPAQTPVDVVSAPTEPAGTTAPATTGDAPAAPRSLDEQVTALGAEFELPATTEPMPMDPVVSDLALTDSPLTAADVAPGADEAVGLEATPEPVMTPAEAAEQAIAEPTDPAAATPAQPWFAAREYTAQPGDTLWGLAERNYVNPYFWPHIFNHNAASVSDPDRIAIDHELLLPALQGDPSALTDADRTSIAEGYLRLYRFWQAGGRANADYALVGVRFFDAGVLPAEVAGDGYPSDALSAAFHAQLSAHYGR